jgi:hypothetical protein
MKSSHRFPLGQEKNFLKKEFAPVFGSLPKSNIKLEHVRDSFEFEIFREIVLHDTKKLSRKP